ncbi:MAG: hypothetical protein HUK40_00560 [Desulfobacter sp.]|nr:hypothetical protein [Desulfobacter sp.]
MESLKNRVLAALYQGDPSLVTTLLETILKQVKKEKILETCEKHLRQIQVALKRFIPTLGKGPDLENLTLKSNDLYRFLRNQSRKRDLVYLDYDGWENKLGLAQWQWAPLFKHAVTFQMTSGCSNYCRRCNEWALPRVRGHFTQTAVTRFIQTFLDLNNTDLALYGGSDPLDWTDPPWDLTHILTRINAPCQFSLLTKIPRARQTLVRQLVKDKIPFSVSLTDRNKHRVLDLEADIGQTFSKQHAGSDLLIPACLDEDFESVKPSITDSYGTEISLDGAFIIIPTFTSALYPFGHKKIPVTCDTPFFPVKKLGRPALLVDYFKPLEVQGKQGKFQLSRLLDVQVENILLDNGDDQLTPPGMRSVKEYFEIFEDKARIQRKNMTLSVVRRIKKEQLKNHPFSFLSLSQKTKYKEKIQAHLDFTRKTPVAEARVSAAAFFMAALKSYLSARPEKQAIIAFLTRKEYQRSQKTTTAGLNTPLAQKFLDPNQDAWALFRYHALSFVHKGDTRPGEQFVKDWQAVYNVETDWFEKA